MFCGTAATYLSKAQRKCDFLCHGPFKAELETEREMANIISQAYFNFIDFLHCNRGPFPSASDGIVQILISQCLLSSHCGVLF